MVLTIRAITKQAIAPPLWSPSSTRSGGKWLRAFLGRELCWRRIWYCAVLKWFSCRNMGADAQMKSRIRTPHVSTDLFVRFFRRLCPAGCWPLIAIPIFFATLMLCGFIKTDPMYRNSGFSVDVHRHAISGRPTIDPSASLVAFALGKRAALEIVNGRLPLWNHYEGLGAPLLGEVQSAALFPPTMLLLLPNGQVFQRALLQLIAGWGAYVFFRRFGLSVVAAVAGGSLYELNGVFSWLHAVFKPVAFLPWLLFAVEELRGRVVDDEQGLWRRLEVVAFMSVVGALAVYAGFPEQVYLYALFVIAWTLVRMARLPWSATTRFLGYLMVAAVLCLALSAPILIAFLDFLPQAYVGRHSANGFYGGVPPRGTFLQYILPYFYGAIFALRELPERSAITAIWGSTGGYVGLLSVVLACASLFTPGYRAVKVLLSAWIIFALGASHGWPVIYDVFMMLPLAKITACFRYLNISWIFCFIFLAVLFIDYVATRPSFNLRVAVAAGGLCTFTIIVVAAIDARHIALSWTGVLSLIAAMFLFVGALVSAHNVRRLSSLLIAEAFILYLLPHFSYPQVSHIDKAAISFLQANVGYQRVVNARVAGMMPNFGSALAIPALNYVNLPVPLATVEYIQANLDPCEAIPALVRRYARGVACTELRQEAPKCSEREWRRRVYPATARHLCLRLRKPYPCKIVVLYNPLRFLCLSRTKA